MARRTGRAGLGDDRRSALKHDLLDEVRRCRVPVTRHAINPDRVERQRAVGGDVVSLQLVVALQGLLAFLQVLEFEPAVVVADDVLLLVP